MPVPSHAALMVVYYPTSTFGPYNEAILGVPCLWQGEDQFYIAQIVVDTVPPLVGGREIWGYPKKIAGIELSEEDEFVRGAVERPAGIRLVNVAMRPERPVPPASGDGLRGPTYRRRPAAPPGPSGAAPTYSWRSASMMPSRSGFMLGRTAPTTPIAPANAADAGVAAIAQITMLRMR